MDRTDLRNSLQDKGFTYRDSKAIVNAIVEAMREGLKRDEVLECPLGKFTVMHRPVQRCIRFGKIARVYKRPRIKFTETKIHSKGKAE